MVSKVEHPLMCLKATSIGFFPSYSLFTYFSTGLLIFSYWYKGISFKKIKVPVLGWYELSFPPVAVYLLTLFMVGFKKNVFIYFNWRIITKLWWLLPYISMNWSWVYMYPLHSEPPPTSLPTLSLQVVTEIWKLLIRGTSLMTP